MKKHVRGNYRVVILPDSLWMKPEDEVQHIRDQVVRHVDVHKRSVSVEWDDCYLCEFCRNRWESSFNGPEGPACCQKAQDEWDRAVAARLGEKEAGG